MFGANSSATVDGGLLQLRALDWNVDGKFHACMYVYELISYQVLIP